MLDSSHRSVIDLAGGFVLPVSQAFASGDTAWLASAFGTGPLVAAFPILSAAVAQPVSGSRPLAPVGRGCLINHPLSVLPDNRPGSCARTRRWVRTAKSRLVPTTIDLRRRK